MTILARLFVGLIVVPTTIWIALAVGVSVLAGLSPSIKAARLEPLETLRLG